MAVILGFFAQATVGGVDNPHVSDDLNSLESPPRPFEVGALVGSMSGPATADFPISAGTGSLSGFVAHSYLKDFYDRIHIAPPGFDIGNILSPQYLSVDVWNAFLTRQTLEAVSGSGTDGIQMNVGELPSVYNPLESRVYTVIVSTDGPPIIDARYVLAFQSQDVAFTIIGRRVVLWPFVPDTGYEETMEWKTDLLNSFNNEQRLALREAPRQTFSHKFLLDEQQFSRAKAISTQWAHRVYGIAVWDEVTPLLNGLTAGSSFIAFDTANADYRDDDLIMLWSSDTNLAALKITTVTSTGVNLEVPLDKNWPKCYIAPLRFARTLSGVEYSRAANKYITAKAQFLVTQNKDLGDNGSFPMYRGKPVMTDRSAVVGDVSEKIARTIDMFDNGSGPIQIDIVSNWARFMQTISFIKNNKADVWKLRKWIHARRGKQRAFWLPSWNRDLVILQDVASTASSIAVSPIGYPLYYTVKDIMIQLLNGTRIFARVTSGITDNDGNETLSLSEQIGTTFTTTDVDFVCFMSHVRFDTDRVTFNHRDVGQVSTSIPLAETPES